MNKDKLKMMELYKMYGYDFPLKAIYHRNKNRVYFVTDFKDGEIIEFWWDCDKSSACAMGNAWYKNNKGNTNLINIKEITEYIE